MPEEISIEMRGEVKEVCAYFDRTSSSLLLAASAAARSTRNNTNEHAEAESHLRETAIAVFSLSLSLSPPLSVFNQHGGRLKRSLIEKWEWSGGRGGVNGVKGKL